MPRNSGGTYTLPNTAFVPNTVISSASVNQNFSDIATALTLSIATDGSSVITGPMLFTPGTVTSPSIQFLGSVNSTGLSATALDEISIINFAAVTVTFKSDNSTVLGGPLSSKSITAAGNVNVTGSISTTGFFNFSNSAIPASPVGNNIRIFSQNDLTGVSRLFTIDQLGNTSLVTPIVNGQCRISVTGGNIVLLPYSGNQLTINNVNRQIPSSGVTLLRAGLTDNTFYYIYAYMSSGVMTLEASTTGHSTQAGTGIEIKTGDPTRTLVGAAYSDVSSFKDQNGSLLTLSWFNRRKKTSLTTYSASRSISSPSRGEVNTEIRNRYIAWADDTVVYSFSCPFLGSAGTAYFIDLAQNLVFNTRSSTRVDNLPTTSPTTSTANIYIRYFSYQEQPENSLVFVTIAGSSSASITGFFPLNTSNLGVEIFG